MPFRSVEFSLIVEDNPRNLNAGLDSFGGKLVKLGMNCSPFLLLKILGVLMFSKIAFILGNTK